MSDFMFESHLILDGYNLIHRARGGFQKGDWPIVFNFFRGLRPLVEKYKPSYIYFVLEGTPKSNLALLPEYKANRGSAPDGFEKQKDAIIDILQHMPIEIVYHPDFEADDVVYNIVKKINPYDDLARRFCQHVFVVSSDSDFTQLLQPNLRQYSPFKAQNVTVYNWREKLDLVCPSFDYVKWKALRGDATDNIPKCPRMNDKTAMELAMDDIKLSQALSDKAFLDAYERNLNLVRFQDFTQDEQETLVKHIGNPDWDYVKNKFVSFDFKSMTKDKTWDKYVSTFKSVCR